MNCSHVIKHPTKTPHIEYNGMISGDQKHQVKYSLSENYVSM
jgi:hypothetical protein